MTERRYFGTDGIRGRVGVAPMTADFALRLGTAAGRVLSGGRPGAQVLIGKDTRLSGYMLESALEAGLAAAGVDVVLLGPMPTPAVAHLTVAEGAAAGIVISASHNPYHDNGIKFFAANGEKLSDALEAEIEAWLERPQPDLAADRYGRARRLLDARQRYRQFLSGTLERDLAALRGRRLVIDCAHGAAYQIAPALFGELGFEVRAIGVEPNGLNINADCGATHPDTVRRAVLEHDAWLGLSLDGDADRLILVSGSGRIVDGDDVLYLLARHLHERGRLRGPVVGTLMTNYGIERAITSLGLPFRRAPVGDRYVHELLKREGGLLGGEASGHLLRLDKATTGDGLLTALEVLQVLAETGAELDELLVGITRYPQRIVNVRVPPGAQPLQADAVRAVQSDAETALCGRGRVVLRASGTEPVIRVTVEADAATLVEEWAGRLAEAVRAAAGPAG